MSTAESGAPDGGAQCDDSRFLEFELRHAKKKRVAALSCKILLFQGQSLVIVSPGGRLRIHRDWLAKNGVIHAEQLPKWLSKLASTSFAQQLIPLRDAIVMTDRVGGAVDILFPSPGRAEDADEQVAPSRRETTVWVPTYATGMIDETQVGAEWWMVNKVLEATARQPLDLDPHSSVPLDRGFCIGPPSVWPGVAAFAVAVCAAFAEVGVHVELPQM